MTFQKDSKGTTLFKKQESRWSTQLICSRSTCHREGSHPRTTSCTHVSFPQAAVPGARTPCHEEAGWECQNKEGQGSSDYLFLLFHTGPSAGNRFGSGWLLESVCLLHSLLSRTELFSLSEVRGGRLQNRRRKGGAPSWLRRQTTLILDLRVKFEPHVGCRYYLKMKA